MSIKQDFPVHHSRAYLEPGPVLLLSFEQRDERNVMTLGGHVVESSPSLVGCMISAGNHSFEMVRQSQQCVLNLPTEALVDTVVGIGNCLGAETDKFDAFALTVDPAEKVAAPLIRDCHASFECVLVEDSLVDRYNFFIFEIEKAHLALARRIPRPSITRATAFMVAGKVISRRHLFKPAMLGNGREP